MTLCSYILQEASRCVCLSRRSALTMKAIFVHSGSSDVRGCKCRDLFRLHICEY
jgi:hypothetical protein